MSDIPKWLNMADWSDMPDVYVTKAECQQGMFWRIEACSVPMVMLPEVRLIRADIARAELEAAVAAERERMGPIADILPDAVIAAAVRTSPGENGCLAPFLRKRAGQVFARLAFQIFGGSGKGKQERQECGFHCSSFQVCGIL